MLTSALADLDDDRLAAAYPWPEGRRWVRANMVMTLDGATVGPDGVSKSLTSGADQRVFGALRAGADAVLVGAGTIRAERYSPMRPSEGLQRRRQEQGLAAAPVVVVVSGSLDLPWEEPMWDRSTMRPLVLTGPDADPERVAVAREHAEAVALPGAGLDVGAVLELLEERGLRRILCEGGARLLADLVADDLLDEADVTLAPLFAGTDLTARTPMLKAPRRFEPVHALHEDGYQMLRLTRAGR
ncbi:MAG: dihydrofolate reductase family protein [Marmoricola sp.]